MSALPTDTTPLSPPPPIRLTETDQAAANPLNDEQMQMLYDSARLARPIRKAERFAATNGWFTLLAGCLTVLFGFGDPPTLVFAVLLGAIGTRELTLRRRLHQFEPRTTTKLALNQVMFGVLLSTYAIIKMVQSATGEGMITPEILNDPTIQSAQGVADMLPKIDTFLRIATIGMYALMVVIAVVVQGGSALYYIIRGPALARFISKTPPWVIELHHAVEGHNPKKA
ncbi:MAG: hypothetical protein JKY96_06995 [Phycisphaerales bacterium]|nr:hypothetical protein [Phycisphaerales bacterium]